MSNHARNRIIVCLHEIPVSMAYMDIIKFLLLDFLGNNSGDDGSDER